MTVSRLAPREITEAIEAFKREATLLAALQHPNIPSVFEHFEEHDHWYMVMSFIQGETLEDYLKRAKHHKLPLAEERVTLSTPITAVFMELFERAEIFSGRDRENASTRDEEVACWKPCIQS